MAYRKHSRRQGVVAFAAITFTAAGLALPIIMAVWSGGPALPGSAVVAAIHNQYTLSHPVRLLNIPALTVESGSLSVSPAQAQRLRTGEAISALLSTGTARLTLESAVIRLDAPGDAPPQSAIDSVGPILTAFLQFAFEGLDLRHSRVVMRSRGGSDIVFSDVDAEISVQRKDVTAKGSFEHRGQRLKFEATLGTSERKAGTQVPLKASVKGPLVEANVDGKLVIGDALQLTGAHVVLSTPDIRRAANWLGAGWPAGPGLGYFRADGQVDWADRVIAFQKAEFSIDDNQATGTLTFGFDGPRPSVEGTLALPRLDLTRYLAADEGSATSREAILGPLAPWLESPMRYSSPLLPLVDADLRISAAKTTAGQVRLGRSAATLSLKSGRLLADVAELEIDSGASGMGQISIDMSGSEPRFGMRGKLSGVETSKLTAALIGRNLLTGRGDIVVDVTARGDTGERLVGSLNGKASLSMAKGGRIGLDLKQLTEPREPRPAWPWLSAHEGETTVSEVDARVRFQNGETTFGALNARINDQLVSAAGRLALASGHVDLAVSAGRAPPPDDDPARQGAQAGLAKVVELYGPWQLPALMPVTKGTSPTSADTSRPKRSPADPRSP